MAVVGGGPVGLSAAHDLALMGYSVTIFEAAPVAGGMLYLGIPEYRLPRDVVEAQVREILATGDITLKLNQAAGRDFTVSDLRRQGFDAVLIAVGAHRSRDLTIPGVDLDGVYKGIDFLLNVNLGYKFTIGKKVIVIGGGNVAMDVARSAAREVVRQHVAGVEDLEPSLENVSAVATKEMVDVSLSALRLGAQEVHLVCLEKREEMPAALEEIEEAETEGIVMHPGLGPKRMIGRDGKVVALETLKTKWVFDQNKRFNPAFYEGSETQLECDTIIMAVGQAPRLDFLKPEDGVELSPRGLIAVNPQTLMTSANGIFGGGDCVFGPRLIIDSVADGKRAAVGIDEFLRGRKHPEPIVEVEVFKRHSMPLELLDLARPPIPMLPLERRTGVTEVEVGYDAASAMEEAQRCLHCWVNTVFEGSPRRWEHVHPVRRLRGCVSGKLPGAGVPGSHPVRAGNGAADSGASGIVWRGTRRSGSRRTRHRNRLRHAERRDSLYSLRTLCHALSGRHHHHGVLQPGVRRADGIDFDRSH